MAILDDLDDIKAWALSLEHAARRAKHQYVGRYTSHDHIEEIELLARQILVQVRYAERALGTGFNFRETAGQSVAENAHSPQELFSQEYPTKGPSST